MGEKKPIGRSREVRRPAATLRITGIEFTTTAAFLFVSQGAAPNFDSQTTYHVTFDASGEPTATVLRIESSCQG